MKFITLFVLAALSFNVIADTKKENKKESQSEVQLKDYDSKVAHHLVEKEGALLLDVRTLVEYKFSSLPNSKRIHVGDLESEIKTVKKWVKNDLNHPIVVFCAAGIRADKAKKILQKHGFKKVVNLGGISDW